jgi:GAF domain-containing protein
VAELSNHELALRMAELARSIAPPRNVDDVLVRVTDAAVELIPGADTAGVLLVAPGRKFQSLFGTSDLVYKVDELQAKYHEGPCLDAADDELMLRSDDFTKESRWPNFSRAVSEIGVRSCLSYKLYAGDRSAGALNFSACGPTYSTPNPKRSARCSVRMPRQRLWPAGTVSSFGRRSTAGTSSARQRAS